MPLFLTVCAFVFDERRQLIAFDVAQVASVDLNVSVLRERVATERRRLVKSFVAYWTNMWFGLRVRIFVIGEVMCEGEAHLADIANVRFDAGVDATVACQI